MDPCLYRRESERRRERLGGTPCHLSYTSKRLSTAVSRHGVVPDPEAGDVGLRSDSGRRFELVIRTTEPGQKVPVRLIVEKLDRLQAALIHLGDYLTGSEFRARGGSTDYVRRRCSLFLSDVRLGSFVSTLELSPVGGTVEGGPDLGQEALAKLQEVVDLVESGEEVSPRLNGSLTDPRHRTRIIKDLREVWPEESERVDLQVSFPGSDFARLTPTGRLLLDGLLSRERDAETMQVKGVLGTAHAVPGESFVRLTGPDGNVTCHITPDQLEIARSLLGRPTLVYGEAQFDLAGNVREVENVGRIEPFVETSLQRLFRGDRELALREPVSISIDFHDGRWLTENSELGISCSDEDYDECLGAFQDEFLFAWDQYGNAADSDLTVGARELKRALREIVEGERR